MKASPRGLKTETFGYGSTPLQKTDMFGGSEVSYHQTYSARDWLSILRTPYPTQNLQRKHRTDQTELASTLATNATKPNPFEIIPLQTTEKENDWKTKETLARAAVTLEIERIKGSKP
jgi:hypothetical protein